MSWAAAIAGFFGQIAAKLSGWVLGTLWKVIISVWSIVFMNIFHWACRSFPDQALELWTTVTNAYDVMPAEWATPIALYIEKMTGNKIDIKDISGGAFDISAAIGKTFLYPMLNLVLPGAEVDPAISRPAEAKLTPADGLRGAENFLGANLHFQMSAWLLHVLGDMQSFGMFKSLKDLPNAISWSYGLGWLSWLVMGVPFRMGISDPLEKYFNLLYRPKELSQKQLIDSMMAGFITWEEGKDKLREMGWSEENLAVLLRIEADPQTTSEMRGLMRFAGLPEISVAEWFKRRGHPETEALWLAKLLADEENQRIREQIANAMLKRYEDGQDDWDETRLYLIAAHYTDKEISLLRTLHDIRGIPTTEKVPTERSLTAAQIGARYKEGLLLRADAESLLTALPYQADQIDLFLDYYIPEKAKVEEPREIGAGVVGGLYKRGELTEAELRADLAKLGYEGWGIERLVTYYKPVEPKPPKVIPPRELNAGIIFQLHEEGHLTTDEAVARLEALNIRPEDARLVLTTLHPLLPEEEIPSRAVPASVYGGLYRDGILEATEAIALFQEVGYDLEGAQWLELYYRPVPPPPPPEVPYRELSATWIFQLHEEGLLPTDEAVDRLVRLRIREGDARVLLEQLHPARPPAVQPPRVVPASIIGGLYRGGQLDTNQALALFEDAGYSAEGAGYLELYYRPVAPPEPEPVPPRTLTATWVLRLHKEGHLTTLDATERLVDLHFARADAVLLLNTLYAVPTPAEQVPRAVPAGIVGGLYKTGLVQEQVAFELWLRAGYDEEGANYLELYYHPPVPAPPVEVPPRELTASWVGRLYQTGVILLPEAISRLGRLRIRAEDAELLLTGLYPLPVPAVVEPKALSAAIVGGLYRAGRIDTEEAFGLFAAADYDEEGVSYLELYYRPEPAVVTLARELRPSEAARLLSDHVITFEEAFARVRPDFVSDDEALLFLHLYVPGRLPPETRAALQARKITAILALDEAAPFFESAEAAQTYLGA